MHPVQLKGHYAGLVRVGRETLAITTDTVGTKTLVAEALGRWTEVGVDTVAINVNDLAAVGARPIGLVDVISCRRADPEAFAALGRGIDQGLRQSRCLLLGGETAIVPELLQGMDVGGTAIGFFPPGRRPVTGSRIRAGDVIVGLRANGLHSNGFTLARRIVRDAGADWRRPRPGSRRPLGIEFLTPTRIYVAASEGLADVPGVTGFAHISGGGVRNLPRLSEKVRFVLDGWPRPSGLFEWLGRTGSVEPDELYQTFNMGIGFVAIVRSGSLHRSLAWLRRAGYADARVVGRVARGRGVALPHLGLEYSGYA